MREQMSFQLWSNSTRAERLHFSFFRF